MIERLKGIVSYREGSHIIVDVAGVGYGIDVLESTAHHYLVEAPAMLWIYTHVREDDIKLFGFNSVEEKILFTHLMSAPGVGAKLAMTMLSFMGAASLVDCILADAAERLKEIPGISSKAKEIQLHLKRRLTKLAEEPWLKNLRFANLRDVTSARGFVFGSDQENAIGDKAKISAETFADLTSALINLGYKEKEIQVTLKALVPQSKEATLSDLLRQAILALASAQPRKAGKITNPAHERIELDKVF